MEYLWSIGAYHERCSWMERSNKNSYKTYKRMQVTFLTIRWRHLEESSKSVFCVLLLLKASRRTAFTQTEHTCTQTAPCGLGSGGEAEGRPRTAHAAESWSTSKSWGTRGTWESDGKPKTRASAHKKKKRVWQWGEGNLGKRSEKQADAIQFQSYTQPQTQDCGR